FHWARNAPDGQPSGSCTIRRIASMKLSRYAAPYRIGWGSRRSGSYNPGPQEVVNQIRGHVEPGITLRPAVAADAATVGAVFDASAGRGTGIASLDGPCARRTRCQTRLERTPGVRRTKCLVAWTAKIVPSSCACKGPAVAARNSVAISHGTTTS